MTATETVTSVRFVGTAPSNRKALPAYMFTPLAQCGIDVLASVPVDAIMDGSAVHKVARAVAMTRRAAHGFDTTSTSVKAFRESRTENSDGR